MSQGFSLPEFYQVRRDKRVGITYGNVPKPNMTLSHLDYSNPMIGYSSQVNVIEGVVYHRMLGSLHGTDGWFHGGNAATAYGVGVISIDGSDDAGRIIEWIDPSNGHYYGESSGPVNQPYGDGLAFVNRFGTSRVNPQTVAIEISGNYDTALDEPARDAIAALSAYYADQRKLPWDQYPEVPGQGRNFTHWHQEFCKGTGKECPGEVVMNATSDLIERTIAILKEHQETETSGGSGGSTSYATKQPIPGPVVTQIYGAKPFVRTTGSLTLAEDTQPLQYATPTATPTSGPYEKGRKISPVYSTIGDDGLMWIVEKSGNRWPLSCFVEGLA